MAASRLPILDTAPSLDDLPPIPATNLLTRPLAREIQDIIDRTPFDAAARRFVRRPGPAERAQRLAQIIGQQPEGL
ncbi:hypothetical protein [Methylobacterium sp. ARG-1]|uniref:hypothetical protein n=1 Tax=Methylobacterium sp. ARG-1 TaxID=1692501 RepID=UPI0006823E9C|nr:hypothetical protein [Methylobacterium sp. ARG-1]KNY20387.1 hypothetical protein AKJ13_22420 [Methylobacterium sp. ARG-1]